MKPEIVNINILADRRAWVSFKLGDSYPAPGLELPDNILDEIFRIAMERANEETLRIKESIEAA